MGSQESQPHAWGKIDGPDLGSCADWHSYGWLVHECKSHIFPRKTAFYNTFVLQAFLFLLTASCDVPWALEQMIYMSYLGLRSQEPCVLSTLIYDVSAVTTPYGKERLSQPKLRVTLFGHNEILFPFSNTVVGDSLLWLRSKFATGCGQLYGIGQKFPSVEWASNPVQWLCPVSLYHCSVSGNILPGGWHFH